LAADTMIARRRGASDTASWVMLAGLALACVVACQGFGFRIAPWRALAPLIGLGVLATALAIGRVRDQPRLAAGSTAFLQMTLFTLLGVALSYGLAARAPDLWDPALAAADAALGFDWPAFYRIADRHPAAIWIGGIAYHSLIPQMIVCIVALSATERLVALRRAVAAAILGGILTIAVSGVMPAMGNVFDPDRFRHLWPSVAWADRLLIADLRGGAARIIDLEHMTGIVSFPSYHATLAVILAWGLRDVPRLRIVAPVWAGVTILATPLFGGHYAVDVFAGLALAGLVVALAPYLAASRISGWRAIASAGSVRAS
jgi:membrane-associated phospholipid phosphatase